MWKTAGQKNSEYGRFSSSEEFSVSSVVTSALVGFSLQYRHLAGSFVVCDLALPFNPLNVTVVLIKKPFN